MASSSSSSSSSPSFENGADLPRCIQIVNCDKIPKKVVLIAYMCYLRDKYHLSLDILARDYDRVRRNVNDSMVKCAKSKCEAKAYNLPFVDNGGFCIKHRVRTQTATSLCKFVLVRGKNKNQTCVQPSADGDTYCKRHRLIINKKVDQDAMSSINDYENGEYDEEMPVDLADVVVKDITVDSLNTLDPIPEEKSDDGDDANDADDTDDRVDGSDVSPPKNDTVCNQPSSKCENLSDLNINSLALDEPEVKQSEYCKYKKILNGKSLRCSQTAVSNGYCMKHRFARRQTTGAV